MFDCPDASQTSPTSTSSSAIGCAVFEPVTVNVRLSAEASIAEGQRAICRPRPPSRRPFARRIQPSLFPALRRAPDRHGFLSRCKTMWLVNGLASFTSASNGLAESANANKLVEMILFMGLFIVMAIGCILTFPVYFCPRPAWAFFIILLLLHSFASLSFQSALGFCCFHGSRAHLTFVEPPFGASGSG